MIQCRVFSCTVSAPSFAIVTVYAKTKRRDGGSDCSGKSGDSTLTRTPFVTATDTAASLPTARKDAQASRVRLASPPSELAHQLDEPQEGLRFLGIRGSGVMKVAQAIAQLLFS